jgi:hypothetical protein
MYGQVGQGWDGPMTRLVAALRSLDLEGEIAHGGTWVTLHGERCLAYVVEAGEDHLYLTWCDDPRERTVEVYRDPVAALQAGGRRSAHAGRGAHESTGTEGDDA